MEPDSPAVNAEEFLALINDNNFKELAELCARIPLGKELLRYENAKGNTALIEAVQIDCGEEGGEVRSAKFATDKN